MYYQCVCVSVCVFSQIKCHLYWPQPETEKENFGNVTVTLKTEIQERDYVVRGFEAKMEVIYVN